jgi:hypothetical protein
MLHMVKYCRIASEIFVGFGAGYILGFFLFYVSVAIYRNESAFGFSSLAEVVQEFHSELLTFGCLFALRPVFCFDGLSSKFALPLSLSLVSLIVSGFSVSQIQQFLGWDGRISETLGASTKFQVLHAIWFAILVMFALMVRVLLSLFLMLMRNAKSSQEPNE